MAQYKRKAKSLEGLTEEERRIELIEQWLEGCRHIDEEIEHERAVLLYHITRIKQLESLSRIIKTTAEEKEKGGTVSI